MADIFALGVIIFIMCTGVQPFEIARMDDNHYEAMCLNRQTVFWAAHETHFGAPFSPEFKDLMTQMLAYQPYLRLNLVEVLMHPFFSQGGSAAPMATKDELIAEMRARRDEIISADSNKSEAVLNVDTDSNN